MTDKLRGRKQQHYDVILLPAASSNHFQEAQAMLRNANERLGSHVPNLKLVMYDLGLNTTERRLMEAHCNCTVLDFPFSDFPSHVSDLICYAWKPLMIHAHMSQADLVMWWDASIRVEDTDRMLELLQRARRVGVQQGYNEARFKTARFTAHEQFYYFGDEPCPYAPYLQLGGNFGIYHNEPFVREAIMAPHAACALVQGCICPRPEWGKSCVKDNENPYGYCHRHDQSALTHILVKLYGLAYPEVLADYTRTKREKMQRRVPRLPFSVNRGDKEDYFGHVQ